MKILESIFDTFWFKLEIASIILAIISYVLIIAQSSINYMFKHYKTKNLVAERLLYEQFSYEIYESILSYPYINGGDSTTLNKENYENSYSSMEVELKIDSFYDCRDVYDPELNEEICQNKIVKNNTCCKSECCLKTNNDETFCTNYVFNLNDEDNIKNNRILFYTDEEYNDDPKRRFCSYYNIYNKIKSIGSDYKLSGYLFRCNYNYIQIFLNMVSNMCIGKMLCQRDSSINIDCGIIDTKGNHLFVDNESNCPINDLYIKTTNNEISASSNVVDGVSNERYANTNKIIIRNILSEIEPDIHEWKETFISLENYGNKESEKYKNLKEKILTTRKEDFKNVVRYSSNIYTETEFSLKDGDFSALNENAKLKLYSTNYIGFESEKDFETFTKYFNHPDSAKNPLYKLGEKVFPSLEAIICGAVLIILCIIYLIFFWLKSFKGFLWLLIVKECVLGVTFIIEFGIYIWQIIIFPRIKINMDDNFEQILDLYNNRRMQYCLLFGLIFLFISLIPFFIFLISTKCKNNSNQQSGNQENQLLQEQIIANENSSSQHQNLEDQQTIERPNHNRQNNEILRNSENQQLNDNIREEIRERDEVIIHNQRNQINKKK